MAYTILLVDDDREFREELRDSLFDYRIVEAKDGDAALKILGKPNEIDLVILDVMMPGEQGTEVLRKIKKASPKLGIIIVTGYSSKDIAIEALKGHADDYIEKPVDIDKLKRVIEEVLRHKKDEGSAISGGIKGKLEKVKKFIQRNYDKKLSLSDAAALVYLSPKYLSRIFRESTGKRFSQYKCELKVKKSQELLKNGNFSISQISEKLGYENTESFIRIFKKIAGHTPAQYRKRKNKKTSL